MEPSLLFKLVSIINMKLLGLLENYIIEEINKLKLFTFQWPMPLKSAEIGVSNQLKLHFYIKLIQVTSYIIPIVRDWYVK